MIETIRKWASKHSDFFALAFPAVIVLLYLWCGCYDAFDAEIGRGGVAADGISGFFWELPSYLRLAAVNSFSIVLGYWAWRSYRRENVPAVVIILLEGLAVILSFFGYWWGRWERLFEFAVILWPVPVTCLICFCMRKLVKNEKVVFVISVAVVFLLAVRFHSFAEGIMDKMVSDDLGVPALWMAESLLWSAVFAFTGAGRDRRRNAVLAWLVCLVLFYFSTFMEVAYLSSRHIWDEVRGSSWNKILFLCWPVFLTVVTGVLCPRMTKDKQYSVKKISAVYFSIVLPLCWLLTGISINFATGAFRDDICNLIYLLVLAEFVIWKEVYEKQERRQNRIGALLFMLLLNAGAALYLLARNERLREVLYYMGFPFMDGSHGLASIRFRFGMLPLLIMVVLLTVTAVILWSRSRESGMFSKCAGYLAFGYLLRMVMFVVLQMNMVWSPYIEFPFTGMDIPEFVVLALLLYEWRRKWVQN